MTTSAELQVVLKAVDRYSKELTQAKTGFQGFAKQALAMGAGVVGVNLGVQAFTRTVKAFSFDLVNAASNAEELRNKFDVTFGGAGAAARAELERFGDEVGRGALELQRMAADTGAVVKSAGLMEAQAAELSVNITKLATDVASFNNANDAEVLHAFTRALTGEREALKTYGVSINQAEVDAKALDMGIKNIGTTMTASDKAMVTYQLLLEKTRDSQGDAARTSDSYASQTRKLKGEVDDLKANLGELLLPTGNAAVTWLGDVAEGANKASTAFKDFLDPTRQIKASHADLVKQMELLRAEEALLEEETRGLGLTWFQADTMMGRTEGLVNFITGQKIAEGQLQAVRRAILDTSHELGKMEEAARLDSLAVDELSQSVVEMGTNAELSSIIFKAAFDAEAQAAKEFADDYRKMVDQFLEGERQREEAIKRAQEAASQSWGRYRFEVSEVGKHLQEHRVTTEQILKAIAVAHGISIGEVIAEFEKLGIAANDVEAIIESSLGQKAVAHILKIKNAADQARQSMADIKAEIDADVRETTTRPELGGRSISSIQARMETLRKAINHEHNRAARAREKIGNNLNLTPEERQSRMQAETERERQSVDAWSKEIAELHNLLRSLPNMQTLTGQMRVIPGPMHQRVPIMAHGGEVIGRPRGGMGEVHIHMDNATFFGIDDAARWVAQMVLKARRLGADV